MEIEVLNGNIPHLKYKSNAFESLFYDRLLLWKIEFGIGTIKDINVSKTIGKVNFVNFTLTTGHTFEAKVSDKDLIKITTTLKSGNALNMKPFTTRLSKARSIFVAGLVLYIIAISIENNTVASVNIPDKSYNEICKRAIALQFFRGPETIVTDKTYTSDSPTARVKYLREDDNTMWSFECKYNGNNVIWRTQPGSRIDKVGRWRDIKGTDDDIDFLVDGNNITVNVKLADGSGNYKSSFSF